MLLTLEALLELIRYDILYSLGGFPKVYQGLQKLRPRIKKPRASATADVCEAINRAGCLYWKPVLCLQRSAATTRLLRRRGIDASMVIGYQPSPFLSHAWVESGGAIINDSPVYRERLLVLDRV